MATYRRLVVAAFRSQLAYPLSFTLQCVGQALSQLTELVAILVLFRHISAMGEFSTTEVLLIYGIAGFAFGLAELVVGRLDALPDYIRTGRLDALLVRPLSALGQICASEVQLRRIGIVVSSLGVLVVALVRADIDWTPARMVLLVVAPVSGAFVLGSVWVVATSVCFWVVEGNEVANSVTYGSRMFTGYPLSIFSPWLRRLMGFVVPGAFVAYFPALALLGKPDPLGLAAFLSWSSPVVAVLATLVAGTVWRVAIRRYRGTGS